MKQTKTNKKTKPPVKKITCTLCDGEGYVSACCAWTMRPTKRGLRCNQCNMNSKKVTCILCNGTGEIDK